jgi:FkbM family methyltransferase
MDISTLRARGRARMGVVDQLGKMRSRLVNTVVWRGRLERLIRSFGWEVRRLDPDIGLDTFLWFMLPHLGVNVVLDVGARHGEFASILRQLGYTGRIVSFEPVHANMLELRRRMGSDPQWQGFQLALGSAAGLLPINVTMGSGFSSFRASSAYGREQFTEMTVMQRQDVQVQRLDQLFSELVKGVAEPRVYLKMDTQGWDLEVFAGASGCLDRVVAVQSELSVQPLYEGMPSYQEALGIFTAAGFELSGLFPVARDASLRVIELDCVLVRPSVQAVHPR